MKLAKTFSVSLMILLTMIVLNIVTFLFSGSRGVFESSDPVKLFLFNLMQVLLIAAFMGVTVWRMMVWDAGDKIPPAWMLILGILSICPSILYVAEPTLLYHTCSGIPLISTRTAFDVTDSVSGFLSHYYTDLPPLLYIGFGVAGLFTKKKSA
jgi:hypothetical protein